MLLGQVIASGAAPVDFPREVRPLLVKRCLACHDAEHAKGGLRLDSRETALKGGKSKQPTLVPGAPAKSALIKRITTHDPDERCRQNGEVIRLDEGRLSGAPDACGRGEGRNGGCADAHV